MPPGHFTVFVSVARDKAEGREQKRSGSAVYNNDGQEARGLGK